MASSGQTGKDLAFVVLTFWRESWVDFRFNSQKNKENQYITKQDNLEK